MKLLRFAAPVILCASFYPAFPQHKVALKNMHERLVLVVPMVGSGTPQDPRRPLYAPVPNAAEPPAHDGIIAFSFVESDDGQHAIVQLVARDRAAFRKILTENRADVKLFDKDKTAKSDIESEGRKFRKNFSLDQIDVGAL